MKLPEDLDAKLRLEAKRRGTTVSELTRTAIETFLGNGARRRLASTGAGRSGRSDISVRIEQLLSEEAERFAEHGGGA